MNFMALNYKNNENDNININFKMYLKYNVFCVINLIKKSNS